MFGGGWSSSNSQRTYVGPRFFQNPAPFNFPPPNGGAHDIFRHMAPPPPPPIYPSDNFSMVPLAPPPKEKVKRWGYMRDKPSRSTAVFFDSVSRPETDPQSINEAAWEEICENVKKAMTEEMRQYCVDIVKATKAKSVLSDERVVLTEGFNPYTHLDLSKATFPLKKDNGMGVCGADDRGVTTEGYSHRNSRYSRQLVRRHNEQGNVMSSGHVASGLPFSNKTWVKPVEGENMVSIEPEDPTDEAGGVEVTIEQPSSQSSSEVSPPDSPGRVRVVCADEEEEMDEATVVRSPARIKSPVRNVIRPSYSTRGRGAMSLRIINGQRITGDSRECYANLNKNCQSGIFCRFEHGGSRAHSEGGVCARLLRGLCRPDNGDCSSSHSSLLAHQFPRCAFYLRGDCSVDNCQLLHVRHSPQLPPCKEFVAGACNKGAECEFPHHYPYDIVKQKGSYATETPEPNAAAVEPQEPAVFAWVE